MHLKTALFGLNFDAFEYSWDETGGATRIGLALLHYAHETMNQYLNLQLLKNSAVISLLLKSSGVYLFYLAKTNTWLECS